MNKDPQTRAAELSFWSGSVEPQPIAGGITNSNFLVESEGRRHFVRVGDDIAVHGVMRFNELSASRAAHAAGISPEVLHHEDGAMVLAFIDGRTLEPADVRTPETLHQIVALLKRCHEDIPLYLRGPSLSFWVFQVLRDYAHRLKAQESRFVPDLERFGDIAKELEAEVGPVSLVFGHNDLLASNLIDDGQRLWLIDWDYAGFNTPLFDLAGLASNNELAAEQEEQMLADYFEGDPPGRPYRSMKCASLLRESMWSMVSEHHSMLDFDFAGYTELNLERFEKSWADFSAS